MRTCSLITCLLIAAWKSRSSDTHTACHPVLFQICITCFTADDNCWTTNKDLHTNNSWVKIRCIIFIGSPGIFELKNLYLFPREIVKIFMNYFCVISQNTFTFWCESLQTYSLVPFFFSSWLLPYLTHILVTQGWCWGRFSRKQNVCIFCTH